MKRIKKNNSAPSRKWMDVSVELKNGMVHWPKDPSIHISRIRDMARGDSCNVLHISMGSHTGTHMDAPAHFIKSGKGIDQIPLDVVVGPAKVIEIKNPQLITAKELKLFKISAGERILFKTQNSEKCWNTSTFVKNFVSISENAAAYLAKKKIKLVGVDYLSVGGFRGNGAVIHRTLLKAGIWIIEGLNLSKVSSGPVELICLPLKMKQGDGAPARAILRPIK